MFATWKKQREVELVAEASTATPPELQSAEPSGHDAGPAAGQPGEDGLWPAMAAEGSSSPQEPAGCSTPRTAGEAASVRQKAQYFEALIRSNTDTLIRVRRPSRCHRGCWAEACALRPPVCSCTAALIL
jgi:hypothetical protein